LLECEKACLLRRLLFLKCVELHLGIILIWGQVVIKMSVHPERKILMLWLVRAMLMATVMMEQRLTDQGQQQRKSNRVD
jgi:hypothetical protein